MNFTESGGLAAYIRVMNFDLPTVSVFDYFTQLAGTQVSLCNIQTELNFPALRLEL